VQQEFENYAPAIARGLALLNSVNPGLHTFAQEIFPKLAPHFDALGQIDSVAL
jgi:hypothetical protein